MNRRGFLRSLAVAGLAAAARFYPVPSKPELERNLIEEMAEAIEIIQPLTGRSVIYQNREWAAAMVQAQHEVMLYGQVVARVGKRESMAKLEGIPVRARYGVSPVEDIERMVRSA